MKNLLKWTGIVLAGVVGLVVVLGLAVYLLSEQRGNKTYEVSVTSFDIPTDAASIAEGERIASIRACSDCHGADYGGGVLLEDPMLGNLYGPNLTTGEGSVTADYTPEDWARAVRHGVGTNGEALLVMPATDYARMSDEDLGRVIAFLQSAPPVDRTMPESKIGPLGRVLTVANQLPAYAAEKIDHTAPAIISIEPEVSVEFGGYVATTCTGCHQPDFAGGPLPGAEPGAPPAANLTPSGHLGDWTYEGFATALRTGVTPENKVLDPAVMPWPIAERMTDVEMEALWLYLQSLPPALAEN